MGSFDKYQTTWKRWLASIIDGLVFLPLSFAATWSGASSSFNTFLLFTILHVVLFTIYVVIGHGRFGQTLGKKVMGIKVLNTAETGTIGYRKAFLRESVWFFAEVACIVISIYYSQKSSDTSTIAVYEMVQMISSGWFLVEVITMLFNKKRRAVHDFIAGSVVVNLDVIKRQSLRNRQDDLMQSLRAGSV